MKILLLILLLPLLFVGCGVEKTIKYNTNFREYALKEKEYELECQAKYDRKFEKYEEVCGEGNVWVGSGNCGAGIFGCLDYKIIKD